MRAENQIITALKDENAALQHEIQHLRSQMHTLEQKLDYFRVFVEGTDDLITQVDRDGKLVYVNQSAERIFGLPAAECIGKSAFDFIHPDDRQRTQQAFTTWVQQRQLNVTFENRLISRSGQVTPMLWTISLYYDDQGVLTHMNSICRDTHALHELTAAAQQSQAMLQLVIDNLPGAVFWKDRDLIYQGCNQVFATFAGVGTPDQIVGKSDYDLAWKIEEADSFRQYDRKVMDSDTPEYHIIETQQHADGKQSWADTNKIPLHDPTGMVIGILGTYEDITERKQAESQLRIFHAMIENAPDGFMLADLDGNLLYANPAYSAALGFGKEAIGQSLEAHIADDPQLVTTIAQQVTTRGSWQGELTHRRTDGTTFPAQVSSFMIYDAQKQPQGVAGIIRDITAQLQSEQERERLQQQVIQGQQAAIRELSTPLIPISDDIVIMPLIGTIDSGRAQMVLETLLEGVADYQASLVILDITGVAMVDTQVAQALMRAAQAVKLLGARVMLTGIQPQIAQTLIHLGVDLSGIMTRSSLQSGIATALQYDPNEKGGM